ncbi:SprT-like domain-containing protein [Flaviaesturariibacter amylovorans]|uniref:SprT-like domain-containing protein n=1 Tax=Flaviaesturariibacter amylovorans TaxID=1084520 RepID=A0ABP8GMC5_9BACT
MAKQEAPLNALARFLPPGTYEPVAAYLHQYHVHLTVARERKSILGDYRHRHRDQNHRISVNGTLNPYAFLITLLHELAHLLTFEQYGNRVAPHGAEWKQLFGKLLAQFIEHNVFPDDIRTALLRSVHNPAASSCADEVLLRTLKKYDKGSEGLVLVEAVPEGGLFQTSDGRVFQRKEKMRKRYRGLEVKTGKMYLFSPVYEVRLVEGERGEYLINRVHE